MKRKAISDAGDRVTILENVLQFFGVASVAAWHAGWSQQEFAFRKSSNLTQKDGVLVSWLRLSEIEASQRKCQPYDAKRFRVNVDAIRALTVLNPGEFLPRTIELCAEAGVALALVPEINGSPVSGAAKWLSKTKGMICVNLRGKYNDLFWFTFFHEAGHILNDSKLQVFVDVQYRDDPCEHEANAFASNLLIPSKYSAELAQLTSRTAVKSFAARIGIHPGIVVGRLQREGILQYSYLNDLKTKFHWDKE